MNRKQQLSDLIASCDAICMWQANPKNSRVRLECYSAKGKIFIVQVFMENNGADISGWEIFIPAHDGNNVAATIDALKKYLLGKASLKYAHTPDAELKKEIIYRYAEIMFSEDPEAHAQAIREIQAEMTERKIQRSIVKV